MKKERWSQEDWQTVKTLVGRGFSYAAIAAQIGRTKGEVKSKWLWETMSPARKRVRMDQRQRRREFQIENMAYLSTNSLTHLAPPEVLSEREFRLSLPRSLTSIICGDPAPGYSALDKKQKQFSAFPCLTGETV